METKDVVAEKQRDCRGVILTPGLEFAGQMAKVRLFEQKDTLSMLHRSIIDEISTRGRQHFI